MSRSLPHAALLVGAVLLVTSCSSTPGPPPKHSGNGGDAIGTITSPSPDPYGSTLTTYVGPVDDALGKLTSAGGMDDLNTALAALQRAADSGATGLQDASVPPAVSDSNRQLAGALTTLSTNVDTVQGDMKSSKVCATSSALAEVGGMQGLKDVQSALQTISGSGYSFTFTVPQTPAAQHRALDNGTAVHQGQNDGSGELTVDNGNGDGDAVLTLAQNGQSAYSFYVQKGQTAKMNGIRDGHYDIYFAGGGDWDSGTKKFTQNCSYTKFDQGADFTTTDTTYSTLTLTLKATVGGNATTSDVPPGQYPQP
ncbi:hypothetical protein E6W39_31830 [Kitasatospora acidiphila]|uniref:Lipoprotein n=1 Tax=Kitasatospora acidiphila TaxID=2567942 RepID=A0A540WAC3_9ACTN|nr:hypothetical protein [Kitasatospora acidiphila]TQF05979.1 hypothetical protein E6W39_31830 [Kitasatospora acidiphila]